MILRIIYDRPHWQSYPVNWIFLKNVSTHDRERRIAEGNSNGPIENPVKIAISTIPSVESIKNNLLSLDGISPFFVDQSAMR